MTHARCLTLLAVALAMTSTTAAQQAPYRIIVNASNHTEALDRQQVAKLFLKRVTRWPDGERVQPVDLSMTQPLRKEFGEAVLQMGLLAQKTYWQRAIFSGRAEPPSVKAAEEEVLAFVAQNPGAIGYVGPTVPLDDAVRVLKMLD